MSENGIVGLVAYALLPAINLIIEQQAGLKAPECAGEPPDSSLPTRGESSGGIRRRATLKHEYSSVTDTKCSNKNIEVANQGSKIIIFNANIRSIDAHSEELQAFLLNNDLKPSLIAFTETWSDNDSNENVFEIEEYYKPVTCNRSWGTRGGVMLYIKSGLQFRVLKKDTERNGSW